MRRTLFLLLAGLAAFAVAIPTALAKGHPEIQVTGISKNAKPKQPLDATVSLLIEGQPWDVSGVAPAISIRNEKTGRSKDFYGQQTAKTGVYRVRVVFPSKAKYSVKAWVDANNPELPSKSFDRVIGGTSGGIGWLLPFLGALALAGAAAITAVLVARTRRRERAPAPAQPIV